jgi:hypothetical protein
MTADLDRQPVLDGALWLVSFIGSSFTQDVVDIPQQRVKRCPTPCGVGTGPTIRTKPCPNFPFRLYLEVVHQFQDNRSTRAFTDGVPRTQDPGRPRIVALESTGRSA